MIFPKEQSRSIIPFNKASFEAKHLVIASALLIILGFGAVLAAYLLSQGSLFTTAITGAVTGSAFLLTSAVACRFFYSRNDLQEVEPRSFIWKVDVLSDYIENPQKVERLIQFNESLYDPTNQMEMPFARLLQVLLSYPNGSSQALLLTLFSQELVKEYRIFQKNEEVINSYIRYLSPELIKAVWEKMPDDFADLDVYHVRAVLIRYSNLHDHKQKNWADDYQEINRAMKALTPHYAFGAALDDGSCLFHSLAQLLTCDFKKIITEKELREKCYAYFIEHNIQSSNLERERFASYEVDIPSWGEPHLHGKAIANIYNVRIVIHEAIKQERRVQTDAEFTERAVKRFESDGQVLTPSEDVQIEGEIHVGAVGDCLTGHYFPIFTW